MSSKGKALVGLDVHAARTQVAVLDTGSGELRVKKLSGAPGEVVSFLEGLGPGVRAVYEAGPTGFGLARAARERGIELYVVAPGSIPTGSADRVKTDRRDAARLARLLAAGELRFAFVASVADERFRDLTRAIEDVRGDLMRARHCLSKFLLRRGERYPGPGRAWTAAHLRWLRGLSFEDACSRASFADYLAAVELLIGRRVSLLTALEQAVPGSSHAGVMPPVLCVSAAQGQIRINAPYTPTTRSGHLATTRGGERRSHGTARSIAFSSAGSAASSRFRPVRRRGPASAGAR